LCIPIELISNPGLFFDASLENPNIPNSYWGLTPNSKNKMLHIKSINNGFLTEKG
jgi:hypothetical protein